MKKQIAIILIAFLLIEITLFAFSAKANPDTTNVYVNGNTALLQLTPSTGTNWQCVDETPASDTDYVYISGTDSEGTDIIHYYLSKFI